MEKTPIPSELYRALAKDYTPKAADMNICRYIAGLEARIKALEAAIAPFTDVQPVATYDNVSVDESPKRKRRTKAEVEADEAAEALKDQDITGETAS